jgi:hypothetical protein
MTDPTCLDLIQQIRSLQGILATYEVWREDVIDCFGMLYTEIMGLHPDDRVICEKVVERGEALRTRVEQNE